MADPTQDMVNALSPSDQAAMMPETYANPLVKKKIDDFVRVLAIPGNVYNSPTPTTGEDLIPQAVSMAAQFGTMGMPLAKPGSLGMAGGKMKQPDYPFVKNYGPTAEEQAILDAKAARAKGQREEWRLRNAADYAEIRQKGSPFVDDVNSPSWHPTSEIDGLINKGQLSDVETARLRFLLRQRYK